MLFDILLDVFKAVAQINEFAEVEAQFAQIPFVDVLFPYIELAEQLTGQVCRRVEVHVVFLLNFVQIGDIPLHRFPLAGKRLTRAPGRCFEQRAFRKFIDALFVFPAVAQVVIGNQRAQIRAVIDGFIPQHQPLFDGVKRASAHFVLRFRLIQRGQQHGKEGHFKAERHAAGSAAPPADGAAESAVKPAISVKLAKLQFILSDGHHAEHSLASFHAGGTPNQKPEVSEPSAFL